MSVCDDQNRRYSRVHVALFYRIRKDFGDIADHVREYTISTLRSLSRRIPGVMAITTCLGVSEYSMLALIVCWNHTLLPLLNVNTQIISITTD